MIIEFFDGETFLGQVELSIVTPDYPSLLRAIRDKAVTAKYSPERLEMVNEVFKIVSAAKLQGVIPK